MPVEKCPPGFWEHINARDGGQCMNCGGTEEIQLAHLIGRGQGKSGKVLRWAEKNVLCLCLRCHSNATEEVNGYQHWNVSAFGDKEANLRAFWTAFHAGQISKVKPQGGWHDPQAESDASDESKLRAASDTEGGLPIKAGLRELVSLPSSSPEVCDDPPVALDPLLIQTRFKAALRGTREGFLEAARLADQILEGELWKGMGCESLPEFLADPEIGMERSKFYRLSQLGRFLRLSGASDAPALPERRWLKILPRVKGLETGKVENPEEVADLIEKAKVLTGADFEITLQEGENATNHPEIPVKIPQDALVYLGDEIVGKVQWVKVGDSHHVVCLAIPHERIDLPLTITLR